MTMSIEATVRRRFGRTRAANPGDVGAVPVAPHPLVSGKARIEVPPIASLLVLPARWLLEPHRFSLLERKGQR